MRTSTGIWAQQQFPVNPLEIDKIDKRRQSQSVVCTLHFSKSSIFIVSLRSKTLASFQQS